MSIESSTLVQFVILADDSAAWEVAGVPQLDRLVLVLNEFAEATGSEVMIDAVIFWRPEIPSAARWLPRHAKIKRVRLTESLASLEAGMRVLNTRLFVGRNDFGEFLQTAPVIILEEPMTEPSILWPQLFEKIQTSNASPGRTDRGWRLLENQADIDKCAGRLLRHAGKSQDGLVSRFLNRPISRLITRQLLKYPIEPVTWTLAILALPLAAFFFLLRGDYFGVVTGAAILQIYSILDGCDGEIARAKYLESERGARMDDFFDMLGSVLFVIGLGFGLGRAQGSQYFLEGILCAAIIVTNEWFLRLAKTEPSQSSAVLTSTLYPRHRGLLGQWPLSLLSERFSWWIIQFTKRDVAIFIFLMLAIADRAQWILHFWTCVSAAVLALTWSARGRARDAVPPNSPS